MEIIMPKQRPERESLFYAPPTIKQLQISNTIIIIYYWYIV